MSNLRSMSFFKLANWRPFSNSQISVPFSNLCPFLFLKSTPNAVTDVCPNPNSGSNPNTNQ